MWISAGIWLVMATSLLAAGAQAPVGAPPGSSRALEVRKLAANRGITPPAGYLIGPDDHLAINFWRDKELSADVIVRPDGRISLPLLNDVDAAGLTPEALRLRLVEEAKRFVTDPTATVIVTEIRSRRAFKPKANQQITADAYKFPKDEQLKEIAREHYSEHRKCEQAETREEPRKSGIITHVAPGIDLDGAGDTGHHDHHQDA